MLGASMLPVSTYCLQSLHVLQVLQDYTAHWNPFAEVCRCLVLGTYNIVHLYPDIAF